MLRRVMMQPVLVFLCTAVSTSEKDFSKGSLCRVDGGDGLADEVAMLQQYSAVRSLRSTIEPLVQTKGDTSQCGMNWQSLKSPPWDANIVSTEAALKANNVSNVSFSSVFGIPEPEIKILHIPKAGGSALQSVYDDIFLPKKALILDHPDSALLMKLRNSGAMPAPPYKDIVFVVRAPVHQFVSGWLSTYRRGCDPAKDLRCKSWAKDDNVEGLDDYYKSTMKFPWFPGERASMELFPTPDALACNLSSDAPGVAAQAANGMNSINHACDDISYYLGGLDGIQKSVSQVLFVGRTEHLNDDYKNLTLLLSARNSFSAEPAQELPRVHSNDDIDPEFKSLSRCAVQNLHKWYAEDYKIIDFLRAQGLLEKSYVDEVLAMDAAPLEGQRLQY
mmetsp:Transcript_87296/g.159556  ORF Transcript_87296/g.159556 Transcript_87296/m.159556 type:complete len:390 (+) Transcript_87296:269-1438(+)